MDRIFHKFPIICPDCKVPIIITSISFSVDNWILVEGSCAKCLKAVEWKKDWAQVIMICFCTEKKDRGNFIKGNSLVN